MFPSINASGFLFLITDSFLVAISLFIINSGPLSLIAGNLLSTLFLSLFAIDFWSITFLLVDISNFSSMLFLLIGISDFLSFVTNGMSLSIGSLPLLLSTNSSIIRKKLFNWAFIIIRLFTSK